ncbi:SDR family oxidoreductase [Litoreibacter roseus]|uniref:Glucose-1-dehydrogenase n=1 Tax=Litoreibacter roseus TaxID=2601869 RepID=A0A6N6JE72_9RHOB|nr:SDR family oxidoreductase [Litoreibacter roseus]GFE63578.1 glucose-1-dehydrogenase [Litoreibacter roseus]
MTRKTVLITGASSGIGAATALLAAKSNYDVGIHYNSDERGATLVSQLCQEVGATTRVFQANVGDSDDITRLFNEFDLAFPKMDALVNNAGIVDVPARVDEMTPMRLHRMVSVNLVGAILVAKEAVLRMSTQYGGDGGVIVNLSSAAARLGSANQYVDYAATKAGIDIFTKGLSDEVANEGIRVAAIRPGIIETAIHAKGGLPDRADDMAPSVPMQRAGTAEECAAAILFLMSEDASYITGTSLDVTGGR